MKHVCSTVCILTALVAAAQPIRQRGPWEIEDSESTAGLRGVHAVGGGVVWASGTGGTVLRSEDTGYLWQQCAMPPGAAKLDFRAIWAWDARNVLVLSSGPATNPAFTRQRTGAAAGSSSSPTPTLPASGMG